MLCVTHLGEHPLYPRPSSLSWVEQYSLLDLGELAEKFPHAEIDPSQSRLSNHQPGDREGKRTVQCVDPNLLLTPVEHRGEQDYFCILHLLEVRLDVVLGAIGGDDLGDTPVIPVNKEDTLCGKSPLRGSRGPLRQWRSLGGTLVVYRQQPPQS